MKFLEGKKEWPVEHMKKLSTLFIIKLICNYV